MVKLSLEFFKFDNFSMLNSLYTVECSQLVLSLSRQLSLYVFNKRIQLFDSILLRLLNFLDGSLDLTDIVLEISKPSTETRSFSSDQVNMLLVDFFQFFK